MQLLIFLFFAVVIIAADVFFLLTPDRTFSENENRVLQQAPPLRMNTVMNGDFMTRAENYVEDQFFFRDTWIASKLLLDRLSGKTESNGVYLGREGYLLEIPAAPEKESFYRNLDAINAFSQSHDLPVVMTLVPPAAWVCDQLVPENAPVEDIREILEQVRDRLLTTVKFVDVTDALKVHKTEPLYYKSDHHWTSLGCRYAFEAMAEKLGILDVVSEYAIMDASYDFSGTMASNSGKYETKDTIQLYVPLTQENPEQDPDTSALDLALQTDLMYVTEYYDTARRSASMYDSEALKQKDQYQVFLGGNHDLVTIRTNADNGRSLLLLKDSYANAFVQFLLPYYSSITIVDPRYYSDDLEGLLYDQGITDVLILYSENGFVTDRSLYGVLEP